MTYVQHVTPGNKRGFVQAKFRSLSSGTQYERRFSSEDKIQKASVEHREMEYLYEDNDEFFFMDMNTNEQISMMRNDVEDIDEYLVPNHKAVIAFHDGQAVSLELPPSVVLKVERTVPGLRHATATSSAKPATVETGLTVQVPQFINEGDLIRVDTSTGEYLERIKK